MPVSEVCQQLLGRFSGDGAYNPLAAISSGFSGTHEADDDDFGDIKYLYICWKPVDLFDQTVVKVYVGPKKTRFFIHKELLCDHSEFFRAALTGGFKEAHEGAVYLPEDELEVFAKLVEWLYADQLDTTFIFREDPDESVCATDLKKVTLFVKLWVLADRLRIPALQRVAVWAVRSFMEVYLYLPTDIVLYIFENTVPSAEFGKLCVDLVEYMMAKRDKRYASLPDNPVLRFVSRARVGFDPPKRVSHCQRWMHLSGSICCSVMSSKLSSELNAHCRSRRPGWDPHRLNWLALPPEFPNPRDI